MCIAGCLGMRAATSTRMAWLSRGNQDQRVQQPAVRERSFWRPNTAPNVYGLLWEDVSGKPGFLPQWPQFGPRYFFCAPLQLATMSASRHERQYEPERISRSR